MMLGARWIALLFGNFAACSCAAFAAEQIGWKDLAVTARPADDPFIGLDLSQKNSLATVLRISNMRKGGKRISAALAANESNARAILESSGLEPKDLIRKEGEFRKLIVAQRSAVRTELDGRSIRIAGYLLPLEFDGTDVVEFLLVPYAGACIHTPPPPPSQIIHVRHEEGYAVQGLFTPVWVTGTLRVGGAEKSVKLSDGSSSFRVGYKLAATSVRRY